MNEIEIKIESQEPQKVHNGKNIIIANEYKKNLLYKFMIGNKGLWKTIKDYSEEKICTWNPINNGEYIVMVQAKEKEGKKNSIYVSRISYKIGEDDNEDIINYIRLNKDEYRVGEKLTLVVETNYTDVMYRYWIRVEDSWELIKDYSIENVLIYTIQDQGSQEILVECKNINSSNKFDDFKTVRFNVREPIPVEISGFTPLTEGDFLVDEEIAVKVDVLNKENKNVLYKFYKADKNGHVEFSQDYSTKPIFSYIEKNQGNYKLLCMIKDMYSLEEYDDRAILNYEVKPYNDVKILNFNSDMASPQLLNREISFQTLAVGGKDLRYRFLIEGIHEEDSGFTRMNTFVWKSKAEGQYTIKTFVKDVSSKEEYEAMSSMNFEITNEQYVPIKIKNIVIDKARNYVKGETITVRVDTTGGIDPLYQFKVYNEDEEVECRDYSKSNWMSFTPNKGGNYKLHIRVKDIGSTKEFDCETFECFNVQEFISGTLDYVLMNSNEYYRIKDKIALDIIAENTSNTYIKYTLTINDRIVEETQYGISKRYCFIPKVSGKYVVDIYGKNKFSKKEYDCKKQVKILVHDTLPVTDIKIKASVPVIHVNNGVDFFVESSGGRDVVYEFYLMERGDWKRVQSYSKKNFYSFMPFAEGVHKLLILAKSFHKKSAYEDYKLYEFNVEKSTNTEDAI